MLTKRGVYCSDDILFLCPMQLDERKFFAWLFILMGCFAGLSAIYDWGQGWIWCQPGDFASLEGVSIFLASHFEAFLAYVFSERHVFNKKQKNRSSIHQEHLSKLVITHQPLNKSPERKAKASRRLRVILPIKKPTKNFPKFGGINRSHRS